VFLSPRLPYGWIDDPPSLNRILGLLWLTYLFFPEKAKGDLLDEVRDFYRLFNQVQLGKPELEGEEAGRDCPGCVKTPKSEKRPECFFSNRAKSNTSENLA
jgi:hypothetical protein